MMISFYVFLVLFLPLSAKSEVLEVTDRNFHSLVSRFDHALVLFYVPWCKRSKKVLPEFSKAAEELSSFTSSIGLFKVDCNEDSEEICQDFSSDNLYPTLRVFKEGIFSNDYNGPQMWYDLVNYMQGQTKPTSIELFSQKDVEYFLKKQTMGATVIGYFSTASPLIHTFKKSAEELKTKLDFAHMLFAKERPSEDKIVLYRSQILANKFENSSMIFSDAPVTLTQFILKEMHGLVGIRKLDNQNDFLTPLIITYFPMDFTLNPKISHYWRNRVLLVAKNFTSITFAISSSDEFPEELESVGIDSFSVEKPVVIAKDAYNKTYVLQKEFSVEALEEFVKQFQENKLEAFVKSEEIPPIQTSVVLTAVGKNFEELVEQNNRDTLVKFYAPWCYHCQNLAPIYEALAKQLQDENIDFVEINVEANDIPSRYEVTGYPTIYWVGKNNKDNPVRYEGERSVDNFLKFIAKEATEELKGWTRRGESKGVEQEL